MSLTRFPQISLRTQRSARLPQPGLVDLYYDDGIKLVDSAGTITPVGTVGEGTPVHGVKATSTLTSDATNVSGGVRASGTLTNNTTNVSNGATVTIGTKVYTYRVFIATGVLTLTGNAVAGQTVTIGSRTYTFATTVDTAANEVEVGATASDSIDNLIAAINGAAGGGTTYGSNTLIHPTVTAAVGAGDTMGLVAKSAGTAGNLITTTETLVGNGSWGAATLTGATGGTTEGDVNISTTADLSMLNLIRAINHGATDGINYKCAAAHTQVTAALSVTSNAFAITAIAFGTAGNSIATTETSATLSWGAATLASGAAAETITIGGVVYTFQATLTNVANNILIGVSAAATLDNVKAAINLDAGAGTTYALATAIHPTVTATTNTNTTQLIEAKVAGTAGNLIATTETSAHLSWTSTVMAGGINNTPANKGDELFDATHTYLATATMTTASTTGWRRTAHSALA